MKTLKPILWRHPVLSIGIAALLNAAESHASEDIELAVERWEKN